MGVLGVVVFQYIGTRVQLYHEFTRIVIHMYIYDTLLTFDFGIDYI